MTVQYCSDLHLEFSANRHFLQQNPLLPEGDILLLAGDVIPFSAMARANAFFDHISSAYDTVFWIPGNHEYYHSDAAERSGTLHEKIRDNVFLVNNQSIEIDSVRFIFSTLWSKISPDNQIYIEGNISDFEVIKFHQGRFTADTFNRFHLDAIDFLQEELNKTHDGKTVVVSHHVPTFFHYPERYKTSPLNEAFAVELFDLIEKSPIDYWIYGHHHSNTSDFLLGKTALCTNQLGYVEYNEHRGFDPGKTIKL
jgi:predicted phosphohydrolase